MYYLEIMNHSTGKFRYFATVKPKSMEIYGATRVWEQRDNGNVSWVKHRYLPLTDTVDLKEFALVKLRSC